MPNNTVHAGGHKPTQQASYHGDAEEPPACGRTARYPSRLFVDTLAQDCEASEWKWEENPKKECR